jgi:hypothetical protein
MGHGEDIHVLTFIFFVIFFFHSTTLRHFLSSCILPFTSFLWPYFSPRSFLLFFIPGSMLPSFSLSTFSLLFVSSDSLTFSFLFLPPYVLFFNFLFLPFSPFLTTFTHSRFRNDKEK